VHPVRCGKALWRLKSRRVQESFKNQQSTGDEPAADVRKQAAVEVVDVDDQTVSAGGNLVGFQVCAQREHAAVAAREQPQTDIGYIDGIHGKPLLGQKQRITTAAGSDVQGPAGPGQMNILLDRCARPAARAGEAMFAIPFQTIRMHPMPYRTFVDFAAIGFASPPTTRKAIGR
jgi:hypothetical protein